MLYLVLGCGPNSMGEAIAWRLLKEPNSFVFIADQNPENERQTCAKLKTLPHGERSYLSTLNGAETGFDVIREQEKLVQRFSYFDVVINALPANLSLPIVEAVLKTNEEKRERDLPKTHYCDLGGVLDIAKQILSPAIRERAERYQMSLLAGTGFQPDTGGVAARYLLEKYFDLYRTPYAADAITIYAGGLPSKTGYKKLFNLKGLEALYYNWALTITNGKVRKIKPLSHYEIVEPHDLWLSTLGPSTKFEAAITSGLDALPYYLAGYAKTLWEKTIRYEGHYELVKELVKKIPREKFVVDFEQMLSGQPIEENDISILRVLVEGLEKNTDCPIKAEIIIHVRSDQNWNSMQKAVGLAAALTARMIAERKTKIGTYQASIALPASEFMDALRKEFTVFETVTYPLKNPL